MSTGGMINICGTNYFTSHDGDPQTVIPEWQALVDKCIQKAKRNPDVTFADLLHLEVKDEYPSDEAGGFPANYSYYLSEDDKICLDGAVQDVYKDGVCPECKEPIPNTKADGDECDKCGYDFEIKD